MNLMFWKKKPEAGNNAEDAQGSSSMNKKERESLDVVAATQDSTESNQESPNPDSPEQEASVKTGLVARMKSKFTSFARHFRKAPAFQAGEGYAPDVHDSSKPAPNDTPAIKSDPETPEKPGLVARIKLKLAALTLHFKKTPAPDAEEDQDKDTRRSSKDDSEKTEETPEKSGLVERIKSNLGAFISHHKKLLIFTLLLLSLIFIVYVAWDIIFPPLERKRSTDKAPTHESAPHEQPQVEVEALKKKSDEEYTHTEAPKRNGSEQAQAEADALKNKSEDAQALAEALKKESEDTQVQAETLKKQSEAAQARAEELRKKEAEEKARVEALKKKEAEDKARAEALKKSSRQQPSLDSSNRPTGGSAAPPLISGEITVDSKDPKATAKSLKEAIEAMNAGSGEPSKNLPNKQPSVKPTQP